jgi:hypothetical protein
MINLKARMLAASGKISFDITDLCSRKEAEHDPSAARLLLNTALQFLSRHLQINALGSKSYSSLSADQYASIFT